MLFTAKIFQIHSRCLGPIGFAGLQVIFVTLTGQGVFHLSSIGLSQPEISIALLSGPVCGAVFQPCFGRWSDRAQFPWGRRKPFIMAGAAVLVLSIVMLAWVEPITRISVSATAPSERYRLSLVIATFSLTFTTWVAIQAVQVGLRTLITDGCSQDEQARANAWAGRYSNFAAVIANFLAYMDFIPRSAGHEHTAFKNMALLASLALIVTVIISCVSVREKQHSSTAYMRTSRREALRCIWRHLLSRSSQIRTVCLVQFFAWMAWFPFLYYTVTYVNALYRAEIRGAGSLSSKAKDSEPRRGLLALLIYTMVSLAASMTLPYLVITKKLFDIRRLWIVSQAIFAISTLGTFITNWSICTIALFGIAGFSWAVSAWVPYVLLAAETSSSLPLHNYEMTSDADCRTDGVGYSTEAEHDESNFSNDAGLIYGIHNLSICAAQIIVTLGMGLGPLLSGQIGSQAPSGINLAWSFRLAGVFSLVAMYIARSIQKSC